MFCLSLSYNWVLVGVASYVHDGCNKPEKPVVFSDVSLYNGWIHNNTGKTLSHTLMTSSGLQAECFPRVEKSVVS